MRIEIIVIRINKRNNVNRKENNRDFRFKLVER